MLFNFYFYTILKIHNKHILFFYLKSVYYYFNDVYSFCTFTKYIEKLNYLLLLMNIYDFMCIVYYKEKLLLFKFVYLDKLQII